MNAYDRIVDRIESAIRSAKMDNMSLGFPKDRIEIKHVHCGSSALGHEGDVIHPTDYVRKITELYRGTWIIAPLNDALATIKAQRDLIERVEALAKKLDLGELQEIAALARAGMGEKGDQP